MCSEQSTFGRSTRGLNYTYISSEILSRSRIGVLKSPQSPRGSQGRRGRSTARNGSGVVAIHPEPWPANRFRSTEADMCDLNSTYPQAGDGS
jgi:hypothetical protein